MKQRNLQEEINNCLDIPSKSYPINYDSSLNQISYPRVKSEQNFNMYIVDCIDLELYIPTYI